MHTKKNEQATGSADWIRAQARSALSGDNAEETYAWVKDVFPDAVIVEIEQPTGANLFRMPYAVTGDTITFSDLEPVAVEYVNKARAAADNPGIELTGPIVEKNEAKRLAFAAVLVPGEADSDGETLTAEKIEDVAHAWLADYGNVDLQHSLNNVAVPVESYILHADRVIDLAGKSMVLPAGTWILGSRIDDADTWARVEKGELTGYSVMGVARAAIKSEDGEAAFKRTLLKDLGDWVAPFVSVVDAPAVPKAKFFAIKEAPKPPKPGLFARLTKKENTDMKADELKTTVEEIMADSLKGIGDRIEAVEAAVKAAQKTQTDAGDTGGDAGGDAGDKGTGDTKPDENAATKELEEIKTGFEALKTQVEELGKKLPTPSQSRVIKATDPGAGGDTDKGKGNEDDDDPDDFGGPVRV